jgi:hypothetical protein
MISFLCLAFLQTCVFDLEMNQAKKAVSLQQSSSTEYLGSLVLDDQENLVFQHFPSGDIKPAIVYIHKHIGKNVRVKGDFLQIKDLEIILVESIELLILEI